jgi:hypothetical protein
MRAKDIRIGVVYTNARHSERRIVTRVQDGRVYFIRLGIGGGNCLARSFRCWVLLNTQEGGEHEKDYLGGRVVAGVSEQFPGADMGAAMSDSSQPYGCAVPGCKSGVRVGQKVCDCCRKKFIKNPAFRMTLVRKNIIPD